MRVNGETIPPVAVSPTEDDVLAYLAGLADADVRRRVVTAALTDASLRARLAAQEELLASVDAMMSTPLEPEEHAALTARAKSLRGRLWEPTDPPAAPVPLGERLREVGRQALRLLPAPITLPGLAPALAAPSPGSLSLHRQTFLTEEGVHIELHQLPGDPPRLRAIFDGVAAGVGEDRVTLRFADGERTASLAVRLGAGGRGMAEALIGAEGPDSLPPAHEGWRLVGVELGGAAGSEGA